MRTLLPRSMRRRLPLSYAAIALLAALALGLVLLTALRTFYRQQELAYLTNNARVISARLAPLIEAGLPPAALEAQLSSFAFLSQARVRLLDPAGQQIVADSGRVQDQEVAALSFKLDVEGNPISQTLTQTVAFTDSGRSYAPFIVIRKIDLEAGEAGLLVPEFNSLNDNRDRAGLLLKNEDVSVKGSLVITASQLNDFDDLLRQETGLSDFSAPISFLPAVGTPYGFGFSPEQAHDGRRSDQVVSQPIYSAAGRRLGLVELSAGPAYGRQVLASVARGWAVAGGVAVLLAAAVGWLISGRLSAPLLALTEVTADMAGGNLSARAQVSGPDEFGTLAHSFNHMARQVEETVTGLRRFVADAAHELHTPLTAMRTNLELVANEPDETARRAFIARAESQVERLEALTNSLLALSRLEAGPEQSRFVPFDLAALVRETSERCASRAEQAGLTFSLDLPAAPTAIRGEPAQLRLALDNLLDNALKFTPEGGAVRVSVQAQNGWVELSVTDTGIGLPAEDLPHLFSRFHRGRNAAAYAGSGLGLAIVKAIVKGHGGQVRAENTERGARFWVRLPVGGKDYDNLS